MAGSRARCPDRHRGRAAVWRAQRHGARAQLWAGRLRELVRPRIAALNDRESCQVARKSAETDEDEVACIDSGDRRFTSRERAALRFAELFAFDHMAIDDEVLGELRRHLRVDEIAGLGTFAGLMLGGGRLAYVRHSHPGRAVDAGRTQT